MLGGALLAAGLLPACDRSEEDESGYFTGYEQPAEPASPDATAEPQPAPGAPRVAGVDLQDHPKAPRSLPKSNDLPGWVKTKPVQVVPPADLDTLLRDERLATALRTFQLEQAAACSYEWPGATADVLFFEAHTPTDAFGVFSLLTQRGGHQVRSEDRSIRVIEVATDAWKMLAWQGKTCLLLRFPGSVTTPAMNAVAQLCNRIVFSVPAADAPLMLQIIPPDRLMDTKVWVVRSTAALRAVLDVKMAQVSTSELDARLGLTGDVLLWIGAVHPPRIEPLPTGEPDVDGAASGGLPAVSPLSDDAPNMLWVAQYQDAASASAAYQQYQQALADPKTDLDRNTQVEPPHGQFLAGTWTMDLEATYPLLRSLVQALPAPMPAISGGSAAPASGPAATEAAESAPGR